MFLKEEAGVLKCDILLLGLSVCLVLGTHGIVCVGNCRVDILLFHSVSEERFKGLVVLFLLFT